MSRDRGASWGLLAAGAALSAALLGVVAWGRARTVEVPQPSRWAASPVYVCGDAAALDEALAAWRELGHPVTRSRRRCDVRVVEDRTLEEHGIRRASATPAGVLVEVEVRVRSGADALTLAHELGHALGYEHPDLCPTGHLMHPSAPGWDVRGLEAS